jgi:hypothetical protein
VVKYIIRKYFEGDIPDIVRLLETVFHPWPNFNLRYSKLDHWKWKHLDNPEGKSFIMVAELQGEIVACAHTIFRSVYFGSTLHNEVCGQDLAVHQDHRGKQLSSLMSDYKYQAQEIMIARA